MGLLGHQHSLQIQLAQCQLLLAEATARGADEPGLSPGAVWAYALTSVLLVIFAGAMAGLTLGLLSLDK